MKPFIVAVLILFASTAQAGNCGVLYARRAVAHYQQAAVVHHAYAPVHYAVGLDIQADAVATKIAEKVAAKLQAMNVAPQAAARPQVLAAKCVRCHQGDEAKGGVVLDGSPLSADVKLRIVEMLGVGKDVPPAMKSLIAGMKPEDKGAITEELLNLETETVSQPQAGELR